MEYVKDLEQQRESSEHLQSQTKEAEKKAKNLEAELIACQDQLSSSERCRRSAAGDRDEMQEEREEAEAQCEITEDRNRKLQAQNDQLTNELAIEKSNSQKADSARSQLERQNKDLKSKLERQNK